MIKPKNKNALVKRLIDTHIGGVYIPEKEQVYTRRWEIVEKGECLLFENGDVIWSLRENSGFPIDHGGREHHLLPERDMIYNETQQSPHPMFSVLRVNREKEVEGLIIPEKYQEIQSSVAFVEQSSVDWLKKDNKVWVNKFQDEYDRWKMVVNEKECFIYPNEFILAYE